MDIQWHIPDHRRFSCSDKQTVISYSHTRLSCVIIPQNYTAIQRKAEQSKSVPFRTHPLVAKSQTLWVYFADNGRAAQLLSRAFIHYQNSIANPHRIPLMIQE